MRRVALLAMIVVGARGALACSCGLRRGLEQQVRMSNAAFTATIVAKRAVTFEEYGQTAAAIDATARVGRVWKGSPAATVRIRTGLGMGDCGVHLRRGATYLVLANGSGDRYGTSICMQTKEAVHAAEWIRALGAPRADRGGDGAAPGNAFVQRLRNVWSVLLLHAGWWRFFARWPLIVCGAVALLAAIFVKQRSAVAMAAWVVSWGSLAYERSALELSVGLWVLLGGIVAAVGYILWRVAAGRRLISRRDGGVPLASLGLAAIVLGVEWVREEDFNTLGVLLRAWQMPAASRVLLAIVPFVLLTLLWRATFASRRPLATVATLALAILAVRTWDLWSHVLHALQ